jgi:hypothetical protein
MTEPEQDPTSAPTSGAHPSGAGTAGRGSATPKWIAALVVTAVVAAGAGWFVADRSTTEDLGEPVAEEAAEDAEDDAIDATESPSWLFSLTATGGTFAANDLNPNIGTLTLTGTSAETTGFTDRPDRDAVTFGTDQLPGAWSQMFADSDPNAVLVTRDADGTRHTHVLELSSPTIEGTSLTFQVAAIEGDDHSSQVPGMTTRAATVPPATFGEVALFIDSVTPPGPHWICMSGSGADATQINPPAPIPYDSFGSAASQQFEVQCVAKKGVPVVLGATN